MRWGRSQRGFSLMELLITIALAAIFFGVIVSVFVGAAKTASKDNLRNIAANVAQSKIEKIRGLQYDQIKADTDHLYNSTTFANGQFGPQFESKSAGGSKTYWVYYATDLYPSDAQAGHEDYKEVQVWVSWAVSPPIATADIAALTSSDPAVADPVRARLTSANSVTLRTLVYKQYAGPGIVGPPRITSPAVSVRNTIEDPSRALNCVSERNMTFVIDVDPDQTSTTAGVDVAIYSATGELIEQLSDTDSKTLTPAAQRLTDNHWQVTWTVPQTVDDGGCTVAATAVSTSSHQGNTASTDFQLEFGPPDRVTLAATSGDMVVQLNWTVSDSDIDHYIIYRSLTTDFGDALEDEWMTTSYTDPTSSSNGGSPLVNETQYHYRVVAVDVFGQRSPDTGEARDVVTAKPVPGPDGTAPYPPSNLQWVASGKIITLSWSASSGDVAIGTTVSGLGDYYLYQSQDGVNNWLEIWHGLGLSRSVGHTDYSQTMYYRVTAKDVALNESAPTNIVAATSDAPPLFNLRIWNPLSNRRYVRVHSGTLAGQLVGIDTGWFAVPSNSTNATNWTNLVVGQYYIEWSTNANGNSPSNGQFTQLASDPYTFQLR
jgi:prepilin-type N-terminal cleavage/methylation domain-containing protein